MAYRVFLSHSAKDEGLVDKIDRRLSQNKFEAYAFEWDRQPGRKVTEKIRDALDDCHALVVILTQAGSASAYVQQEIGYAHGKDLPVIPLVEPGVDSSRLAMLHGIEYIQLDPANPKEAIGDLLAELKALRKEKQTTSALLGAGAAALAWGLWGRRKQPPGG